METQLQRVDEGLGYLCRYLEGGQDMLARHSKAAAYYREAQADPILRRVLEEMVAGMKAAGHV